MEKRNQESQNIERVHEVGEDSTKYGEFISSYFAWDITTKPKRESSRT